MPGRGHTSPCVPLTPYPVLPFRFVRRGSRPLSLLFGVSLGRLGSNFLVRALCPVRGLPLLVRSKDLAKDQAKDLDRQFSHLLAPRRSQSRGLPSARSLPGDTFLFPLPVGEVLDDARQGPHLPVCSPYPTPGQPFRFRRWGSRHLTLLFGESLGRRGSNFLVRAPGPVRGLPLLVRTKDLAKDQAKDLDRQLSSLLAPRRSQSRGRWCAALYPCPAIRSLAPALQHSLGPLARSPARSSSAGSVHQQLGDRDTIVPPFLPPR